MLWEASERSLLAKRDSVTVSKFVGDTCNRPKWDDKSLKDSKWHFNILMLTPILNDTLKLYIIPKYTDMQYANINIQYIFNR